MGKVLATSLSLHDENMKRHKFEKGTKEGDIPSELRDKIDNESVWADENGESSEIAPGPDGKYSRDVLENMTVPELADVCKTVGAEPEGNKKADYVDAILDAQG